MPGIDPETVRHALEVARKRGFAEVEIELDGARFAASLEKVKAKPKPAATAEAQAAEDLPAEIQATLVGYYQSSKPALEVGRAVKEGEVVAVINALGLANDIETPYSGEIVEVLVKDGEPVEYGQPLARVKVGA